MPNQMYATTRRRVPYSEAQAVRTAARRLPQIYAEEDTKKFREQQQGLAEERLSFEKESYGQSLAQGREQFNEGMQLRRQGLAFDMEQARESERLGRAGLGLQAGMMGAKLMSSQGMFDGVGARVSAIPSKLGIGGGREAARDTGFESESDFQMEDTMREGYQEPGFADNFLSGGWKSSVSGGISGGLLGSGLGSMVTKSKPKRMLLGAAGGAAMSYLGGGDLFSSAMSGIIGGGLGAIF